MRECSQYSGLRINSACIYLGDGNFTDAVRTFPRATTMAEVGRKLLTGRAEITPPSLADSLRRSVREAVTTQDRREDASEETRALELHASVCPSHEHRL